MAKFCEYCGSPLLGTEIFCANCGKKIEENALAIENEGRQQVVENRDHRSVSEHQKNDSYHPEPDFPGNYDYQPPVQAPGNYNYSPGPDYQGNYYPPEPGYSGDYGYPPESNYSGNYSYPPEPGYPGNYNYSSAANYPGNYDYQSAPTYSPAGGYPAYPPVYKSGIGCSGVLSIILVIIMVIELAVAAFMYPGFIKKWKQNGIFKNNSYHIERLVLAEKEK
ncbi:hypothetical protein EII17_14400 [Clostridiales bacterium COT073_COT-073]|nr:hypothetical protein EII17_14400 [Clostridiales bacterium COT073_COT-073]